MTLLLGGAAVLAAGAGGADAGAFRPEVAAGNPVFLIFPIGPVTGDNARLNLDPVVYQYGILTLTWQVRNAGAVTGLIGGHVIIQERGPSGENAVIEGDWERNAQGVVAPRLRTANLSTAMVPGDASKSVSWNPPATPLAPGAWTSLGVALSVGSKLLEGKSELDIVVIVRRLDTLAELRQIRFANALEAIRSEGFVPVLAGTPAVEILT